MALPKVVICILGDEPSDHPAEAELRSTGFATFSVTWKELDSIQNGWIQLISPLEDPTVTAWAIVGKADDFTNAIRCKIAMLTLAMERPAPPATAFVITDEGSVPDLPYSMGHIQIFRHPRKYAVELLVAKVKPQPLMPKPFYVKPHLDPLVGAWLEVGPPADEQWSGFMTGLTNAKISSFGIGPCGAIPAKSTLSFPILGIEGTVGKQPFNACAAKDTLSHEVSCYIRLDGLPDKVFCMGYPDEENQNDEDGRPPVQFEFV